MARFSKETVRYTDHGSRAEHCSNCEHYVNPTTCAIVVGKIDPGGWCEQWLKASARREDHQ